LWSEATTQRMAKLFEPYLLEQIGRVLQPPKCERLLGLKNRPERKTCPGRRVELMFCGLREEAAGEAVQGCGQFQQTELFLKPLLSVFNG